MIKVENISKKYGKLEVLKDISLNLNKGEITSIVGASGAGKSTLLQIIGSLDKTSSGSVIIDGINITELNQRKIAKFRNENLGFVFQFHHLLPEFSAVENIIMPGLIGKKNKRKLVEEALRLLKFLNLENRADHKPSEMSGGEQQRVAIARALINKPKIILADEPSGNLDSQNANDLHQLFKDLKNEFKQTFVIVTHNKRLAEESDRVIELKDGVVVSDRRNDN
jgi:lipoprotein-releasing system ATP-binding protein